MRPPVHARHWVRYCACQLISSDSHRTGSLHKPRDVERSNSDDAPKEHLAHVCSMLGFTIISVTILFISYLKYDFFREDFI